MLTERMELSEYVKLCSGRFKWLGYEKLKYFLWKHFVWSIIMKPVYNYYSGCKKSLCFSLDPTAIIQLQDSQVEILHYIYIYMWDLYYIHLLARIPYPIPVFLRKWQPPSDEVTHHMIFEVLHSSTRSKLLESRRIHYFHMKVFCQDDSTGAFSWKLYGSPPALRYR